MQGSRWQLPELHGWALPKVKTLPARSILPKPCPAMQAYIVLDLAVDLTSEFTWNTKQIFAYASVQFVTRRNERNDMVLWSQILLSKVGPSAGWVGGRAAAWGAGQGAAHGRPIWRLALTNPPPPPVPTTQPHPNRPMPRCTFPICGSSIPMP